ncbi:MAG: hypothetical protein WDM80_01415 [Limisphaerales bacterium]
MFTPRTRPQQLLKFAHVGLVIETTPQENQTNFFSGRQRIERPDERILVFPVTDISDAQDERRLVAINFWSHVKKTFVHRVWHQPGFGRE